jgi:hypothetical protein
VAAQASTPQQGSGGNTGVIVSGVVLAFVMMGGLLFTGRPASAEPNPNGAMAAEIQNPSDPQIIALQDSLKAFTEPKSIINDPNTLKAFVSTATKIASGLGPPPQEEYKNIPNPEKVKKSLEEMITLANKLQGISNIQSAEGTTTIAEFIKKRDEVYALTLLGNGNLVDIAKDIIKHSETVRRIPYSQSSRQSTASDSYPLATDCSGFMSFILSRAGYPVGKTFPNTEGFFDIAQKGTIARFSMPPTDFMSNEEVAKKIDDGTIIPGDMLLQKMSASGSKLPGLSAHIIMYIGKDGDNYLLAESGGSYIGNSGVKTSNLLSGYNRKIMAGIRFNKADL